MNGSELHAQLGLAPGCTAEQVDAAWIRGGQCPEARLAWRILRDPAFEALAARGQDLNDLTRAGWFDDGYDDPQALRELQAGFSLRDLPIHNLRLPAGQGSPVVLAATGAFSPAHRGHVAMMRSARETVEEAGHEVLGGYLCPDHDQYVSAKYDGQAARPIQDRISEAQSLLRSSSWLMVDPWPGRVADRALNFTDVLAHLQHSLRRLQGMADVQVWMVLGSDNQGFADALPGGCVIVPRDGHPVLGPASDRCLHARSTAYGWESSTRVRQSRSRSAPPRRLYAMRDDLAWATEGWNLGPGQLQDFAQQIIEALSESLGAGWETQIVGQDEQCVLAEQWMQDHLLLGLDAATPAHHHLHLTRLFEMGGSQTKALSLVERYGCAAPEQQAQQVPSGTYVLFDDDIASGQTMKTVRQILPYWVRIHETRSLVGHSLGRSPDDVVDLRDFLLGSRQGGLTVQTPSGPARALYAAPWVNLTARASIAPEACDRLSQRIWQANYDLHRRSGLTVAQADPACQRLLTGLGYDLLTPLHQVVETQRGEVAVAA